jgi:hypothetical protein
MAMGLLQPVCALVIRTAAAATGDTDDEASDMSELLVYTTTTIGLPLSCVLFVISIYFCRRLQWLCQSGAADRDWASLEAPQQQQQPAGALSNKLRMMTVAGQF